MILPRRRIGPWLTAFVALLAIVWHLPVRGSMANNDRLPTVDPPRPAFAPPGARDPIAGPLHADLLRVIDGDTFEARVRVWFGQEVRSLIRIRGYDAPERAARCAEEASRAAEASATLQDILASGPVVISNISGDKYFGRVVAQVRVRLADGLDSDVAELMLAAGYGRPYDGRRREGWCGREAQRTASTGVPTGTRANRSITSSSSMRMQP
jgi:endonuclease YncB( thermonuclease family)